MKKTFCALYLLLLLTAATAQTKQRIAAAGVPRENDRAAAGYKGNVALAVKITWKNAPDSLLNNIGGFDSLYNIAEQMINGHFTLLSTYYRQQAQQGYIDVAIVREIFDSAGNALEEADLMAANAMNITYNFGRYNKDKSIISIYNNHSGDKAGTGYIQWSGNNKRVQHTGMNNGFVIDETLELADHTPVKKLSTLKYKDAFIISAQSHPLSKSAKQEIWEHTENTKTLYKKLPDHKIVDTITHHVLEQDAAGNTLKEVLTHSNKGQKTETVFHRYEYIDR